MRQALAAPLLTDPCLTILSTAWDQTAGERPYMVRGIAVSDTLPGYGLTSHFVTLDLCLWAEREKGTGNSLICNTGLWPLNSSLALITAFSKGLLPEKMCFIPVVCGLAVL